jgi:hypothetical protein
MQRERPVQNLNIRRRCYSVVRRGSVGRSLAGRSRVVRIQIAAVGKPVGCNSVGCSSVGCSRVGCSRVVVGYQERRQVVAAANWLQDRQIVAAANLEVLRSGLPVGKAPAMGLEAKRSWGPSPMLEALRPPTGCRPTNERHHRRSDRDTTRGQRTVVTLGPFLLVDVKMARVLCQPTHRRRSPANEFLAFVNGSCGICGKGNGPLLVAPNEQRPNSLKTHDRDTSRITVRRT